MKKVIILLFSLCLISNVNGQISYGKDHKYNTIVKVSIDNLIGIMEMSSSQMKSDITSHGYNQSTVENDCVTYVKGSSLDGTIHGVTKCSKYLISIGWFNLSNGKSNLTTFIDEIESYYAGYDSDMQNSYYQVKRNNFKYNFYIMRNNKTESVFCKKVN